jgi:hypothetical protein
MKPADLTLRVLTEIRDEIRGTNSRLDATNSRVDGTNVRVDALQEEVHGMRVELARRIVESEVRTSTAITDLIGTVGEMTSVLRAANDLRPRVERCEQEIAEIKRRVR